MPLYLPGMLLSGLAQGYYLPGVFLGDLPQLFELGGLLYQLPGMFLGGLAQGYQLLRHRQQFGAQHPAAESLIPLGLLLQDAVQIRYVPDFGGRGHRLLSRFQGCGARTGPATKDGRLSLYPTGSGLSAPGLAIYWVMIRILHKGE